MSILSIFSKYMIEFKSKYWCILWCIFEIIINAINLIFYFTYYFLSRFFSIGNKIKVI